MGKVILGSIVLGIIGLGFLMFVYLLLSFVITIIKNIGKEEFTWYGQLLNQTRGAATQFDSFKDMVREGFLNCLVLAGVMYAFILFFCIYITFKG